MENTTLHHRQDTKDIRKTLFDALRLVRREIAKQKEVDPYMVFTNQTLEEMAIYTPVTEAELLRIYGVSEKKLEEYGKQFLVIIQEFVKRNEVQPLPVPTSEQREQERIRSRHSTYGKTRKMIEEKMSIKAISLERKMKEGTIISHIEKLRDSDPNLDIRYLKPSDDVFSEIEAAFAKTKSTKLVPVYKALDEKYSFDEIRLSRLFL